MTFFTFFFGTLGQYKNFREKILFLYGPFSHVLFGCAHLRADQTFVRTTNIFVRFYNKKIITANI